MMRFFPCWLEYCTPWPRDIGNRPIRITTINHVYSGPSIRHPDSNKVKLQVIDLIFFTHVNSLYKKNIFPIFHKKMSLRFVRSLVNFKYSLKQTLSHLQLQI